MIVGVDEVGRGPLVGNVVTAAVILPEQFDLPGLTDSKKLSEKKRELLVPMIQEQAIAWAIGECTPEEIDQYNILQATLIAMQKAVNNLNHAYTEINVDGNRCPEFDCPCEAIVKGDSKVPAIAAASILAKVYRDQQMLELDKKHPEYGFAKHKGYPTKAHFEALEKYGVLPEHRRSFKPVAQRLGN